MANSYLARTPSSAGNKKIFTISMWLKRSSTGVLQKPFSAGASSGAFTAFEFPTDDKPRFVYGSLGPTNRTACLSPDVNDPSYREVTFDDLVNSYTVSIKGLMEGGADILMVETIFDTLNSKAAIFAIDKYCRANQVNIPVMISGTITDSSGRTLSGQTTEAFFISLIAVSFICVILACVEFFFISEDL